MQVVKRDGRKVDFDQSKISNALLKAFTSVDTNVTKEDISIVNNISDSVTNNIKNSFKYNCIDVEQIQDIVEKKLFASKRKDVALAYDRYRQQRTLARKNTIDDTIQGIVNNNDDYWTHENANKNPRLNTTQRDYMAGAVSTDATRRYLLPSELVVANDLGLLHFHDADYFSQRMHNCDLINLDDMLQNGTVISETMIEKPKSFQTACTVTTQIIAQVASSQYGGQSISLEHLAPFVEVTRQKAREKYQKKLGGLVSEEVIESLIKSEVSQEIKDGIQTIQYQLVTLMTTNGQAPFITIFMYLNESRDKQTKKDLVLLVEEMLRQRIQGVKNEDGVYVAPAFPKLIYVLEDDNCNEDTPYWYLTQLAAECSSKRLVPDYISEKMMLELKGDVYTCMGCVDGSSNINYKIGDIESNNTFENLWDSLSNFYKVCKQPNREKDLYIDLRKSDFKIWDSHLNEYSQVYGMIRNVQNNWIHFEFSNGARIDTTDDHPFEIKGKGITLAKDVTIGSEILDERDNYCSVTKIKPYVEEKYSYDVTTESEHFTVNGIYSHNCRSFLTPDDGSIGNVSNAKNYKEGQHKYYGRFNQGVVTINLPDIAFSSEGDMKKFWQIFEERTELCHKALQCRHKRLLGTSTQVAPLLWQYGALARLGKDEKIDKLLFNNYSTISLGYCGLYETVKYMTGHSHSDEGIGEKFGLEIMQALNDKCSKWRAEENISYSLYGTPLESTTYKIAKCLKKRFGDDIFIKLDGKDRNYVTNSYHIPVFEKIDAFDKLRIESKFQKLSPGGAISYIETPQMSKNVPALLEVIKYMYDNIMYSEINTKSCYCEKCGYEGDIPVVDDNGELKWVCPQCGNEDSTTMDIAFRVCGYIGTAKNGANQGRMGDIKDRVYHLDDVELSEAE